MTTRVLPPPRSPAQILVYGRTYVGTPGIVQDVPDHDAQVMGANGWLVLGLVGSTAQRPINAQIVPPHPFPGQEYLDTTVGAVLVHDGAVWRNKLTGAAA